MPQLDIRDPEAVKVAVDKIEMELGLPSVVKKKQLKLLFLDLLYGTMRNVRGSLEGGLDEARSGRVLWLRRGGLDALVGQRNQREEGGEFRLSDEHLSDFYV